MNRKNRKEKLVSVIVPVYNTKESYIKECLDSIANQTLDKKDFEIIIVDDYSNKSETLKFIKYLESKKDFKGIDLRVIRHSKNLWLAKTRITGAKNAWGRYIVFLDSDDMIKKDYLKKAVLLLETSPKAGWVYPDIRRFGYFDDITNAPNFNPWNFFIYNYCANASLFRKFAWMQVKQREKFVTKGIRFFEDWDTIIRLMAKGWYGLPMNDSEFLYRQHYRSIVIRSLKMKILSNYIVWRSNIFSYLKLIKSGLNYSGDFKRGFKNKKSFFNPIRHLDDFSSLIAKKIFGGYGYYQEGFFSSELLFYSIFEPKKLIKKFTSSNSMTFAESICEFKGKPIIDFPITIPPNEKEFKTVFFVHPWWLYGGAENVLLNWMKATKKIKNIKIIDLVRHSTKLSGTLKEDFSKYADEQYALDKIANTPLLKLKFCWNLITKERPDVIFISSNSFFYTLIPLIKKRFPDTKIVDILHSDEPLIPLSWFTISDEYKELIDERIVISELWKNVLISKYGEKENKVNLHKNFIDINRFNPDKYNKLKLRKDFNISPKKFIIGFISRFHEDKNPLVFVELADLLKDFSEYGFFMMGGGDLEKEIRKKAKSLPNIDIRGYSRDISKYLKICDVLICPSKHEGYPLIGLEAAAMNIPVIATDINGFREQIELGKFGFLYKQKDIKEDAEKIKEIILENKDKFERIGKNGRKFVLKHHNPKKLSKEYEMFMRDLLG